MGTLNLLLENLDPLAQLLLQAFFKTLWQGTLIAAIAWLLLRVFKSASATTRHAVWLVSLIAVGALPFIAIATKRDLLPQASPQIQRVRPAINAQAPDILPPVSISRKDSAAERLVQSPVKQVPQRIITDWDRAAVAETALRAVTLAETAQVAPAQMSQPATFAGKSFLHRLADWFFDARWQLVLASVWLIFTALMFGRVALSYQSLSRMRRSLSPAAGEQQARVEQLAGQFGIRRFVLLFTSPRVTMPMTVGAFKPVIVVPPDLARGLSAAEFDSVVAHELAHIRRWDYLTNLLQRFVQAFLFFHPVVWLIGRQLMIERELACDDWAVKISEPRRYASCLTRLVELLGDSRPLAAAAGILFGKHVISRRVEMILNRDRNATTAVSKPAVAYAISLAALLVAACSLMSPVIAVPLGQQKAKQQKKESKPAAPVTATGQITPLPPLPPDPLAEPLLDVVELADVMEAPLPPLPDITDPEIIALEEAVISIQDTPRPVVAPAAPAAPATTVIGGVSGGVPGGVIGGVAATAPVAPSWDLVTPAAATAWGQDDRKRTPAIPEAELLTLLVDIVKRDTDPNVRQEALQGIYRMRSEAATGALIQLYDTVTEPKTKSEIIAYMLRREGDNSKAIAKLTQIAKTETNEDLRNRAIRYLGNVKGDEGANNLIAIYDSLQDAKMKQYVIRSLAYNKSPKAIEKLKQIAKNDSDPQIRSAAIRSLYSVDSRLYLDTLPPGARIGMLDRDFNFDTPRAFSFDGNKFEFDARRWEEMQKEWQEQWKQNQQKYRELIEKMQFDGLDKLRIEMPKIELHFKELQDRLKDGKDINLVSPAENKLRSQIALVTAQLNSLSRSPQGANPTIKETIQLLNTLQRQLNRAQVRTPVARPVVVPSYEVAPTPRPAPRRVAQSGGVTSNR